MKTKEQKAGTFSEVEDHSTTMVRLWLDEDIIEYFKSEENYEEAINMILRSHVEADRAAK